MEDKTWQVEAYTDERHRFANQQEYMFLVAIGLCLAEQKIQQENDGIGIHPVQA